MGHQPNQRPRVVIAEDFVLIQEMIRDLLEPECEVVAMVEDGNAAIASVAAQQPQILLVDASLPIMSGFAVAEALARTHPQISIMFVTAHADPNYVERAFEIGARAYLLKGSIQLELLPAVRQVLAGGIYRSAMLTREVIAEPDSPCGFAP
jgi:DNA-binding NarL/FixJ family response regulator